MHYIDKQSDFIQTHCKQTSRKPTSSPWLFFAEKLARPLLGEKALGTRLALDYPVKRLHVQLTATDRTSPLKPVREPPNTITTKIKRVLSHPMTTIAHNF